MPTSKQIRIAAALLVALTPMLFAQMPTPSPAVPASQLPATPATSLSATPAQQTPKRAIVTYNHGQISVIADNASLNQILLDIAQQTGMKITGAGADERVYGSYGPAAPAKVLALLLDGIGSNILLVQTAEAVPTELILTLRNGGPSPPNPNATGFNDEGPRSPIGRRPPGPPNRFPNNPLNQINNWNNAPQPINPPPTPLPADTTMQQSPNGVKSPQQIYEQLQRMQQPQGTQPQQGAPIPSPQ